MGTNRPWYPPAPPRLARTEVPEPIRHPSSHLSPAIDIFILSYAVFVNHSVSLGYLDHLLLLYARCRASITLSRTFLTFRHCPHRCHPVEYLGTPNSVVSRFVPSSSVLFLILISLHLLLPWRCSPPTTLCCHSS